MSDGYRTCTIEGCNKYVDEAGYHLEGDHHNHDSIPEETPEPPVEDNWEVEIMVTARNTNDVTQVSSIQSENKITVRNIVSDSELLRILNFIQPKP